MCRDVGLPVPRRADVTPTGWLTGAASSREHGLGRRDYLARSYIAHLRVEWSRKVPGTVAVERALAADYQVLVPMLYSVQHRSRRTHGVADDSNARATLGQQLVRSVGKRPAVTQLDPSLCHEPPAENGMGAIGLVECKRRRASRARRRRHADDVNVGAKSLLTGVKCVLRNRRQVCLIEHDEAIGTRECRPDRP
jgi:hypothetical protein